MKRNIIKGFLVAMIFVLPMLLTMCNDEPEIVPNNDNISDFTSIVDTIIINGVELEMVYVEGGTFKMGTASDQESDEYPAHNVTLDDYYIGKYEVTQELWMAVMDTNQSYFKDERNPMENVSWNDCQDFIRELNSITGKKFRLPTEAEWEYAARGGNESKGYKYSGSNYINDVAWYYDNSELKTHTVGTKSPNELGIYDMSGNVFEWCIDWYASDYYEDSPNNNPQGPSSGSYRVNRGGSWDGVAQNCSVRKRDYNTPTEYYRSLGLRLVMSSN